VGAGLVAVRTRLEGAPESLYCVVLAGSWFQSLIKIGNLEKVQKRAARFVFNNYTDRTPGCVTKMVESLKWEKLEERRKSNRLWHSVGQHSSLLPTIYR
jgi:hypothetical protein